MPAIMPVGAIAAKWSQVTPTRSEFYKQGVTNPKNDWASNTENALTAWQQGIQNAMTNGSFVKGVVAAGTAKWKNQTINLGVPRWGQGVQVAGPAYQAGFSKYRDVIANTTLPPRGAKGSPQNAQRSQAMAAALHSAKVGG
mgnify:CR=1 FL=1